MVKNMLHTVLLFRIFSFRIKSNLAVANMLYNLWFKTYIQILQSTACFDIQYNNKLTILYCNIFLNRKLLKILNIED